MYMFNYRIGKLEVLEGFKRRRILLSLSLDTGLDFRRVLSLLQDECRRSLAMEMTGEFVIGYWVLFIGNTKPFKQLFGKIFRYRNGRYILRR